MEKIISHIYYDNLKNDWIIQSNEEHSEGVAELASNFAASFGMSTYGKILGLLHDKGKESKAFQQHIKKVDLHPIQKFLVIIITHSWVLL